VSHPNIVKLHDLFQDSTYLYVVTEYFKGGDLLERLLCNSSFSESDAAFLLNQILQGISCLHKERIVHRDLKLENILVDDSDPNKLTLKIADFGFARKIPEG
jgi:serine/threonine protein kinase